MGSSVGGGEEDGERLVTYFLGEFGVQLQGVNGAGSQPVVEDGLVT